MDPEPSLRLFETLDTNLLFGIIGVVLLLFCCAMVAAAEVAFFSLTSKDLSEFASSSSSKAKIITNLLEKPKKLLATILVANNFLHIAIVILFSFSLDEVFSTIASPVLKFAVEVILVTFLILLFGEVLPKIYASRNNVKFASFIALPLSILDKLLTPISLRCDH